MIGKLTTGVLLLGLVASPAAAHTGHDQTASAAAPSRALSVSTQATTVSEARAARVTVRCASSTTCRGTIRLRVAGSNGKARSYRVASRVSKTYTLTVTAAQLRSIPQGASKTAALRITERKPRKVATRSAAIRLTRPAAPVVAPAPVPTTPEPAAPVLSTAYKDRNWTPTAFDTCPASLHRTHSVIGPDGKLYPTWHAPTDVDPATGQSCTYGHEHGDDPSTSDLYTWVTDFLDADPATSRGIPFGYVSEALDTYSTEHDLVTRHEDNVGHKLIVANDIKLVGSDPRGYVKDANGKVVTCDYLIKVHQGSHSGDGLMNNAHELLYAIRCTDGTELISSTLTRFGDPNEFARSCDKATVATSGSKLPDGFGGRRIIPDRFCVDRDVLVPDGQTSKIWALYEVWESENRLQAADGTVLASFDPWFGVRNPSRLHGGGIVAQIADMIDTLWLVDPADGGTAQGYPWDEVADPSAHDEHGTHVAKGDPASPFDGAQRDYYLHETAVDNAGGATQWWSDPYGDEAVTVAAPGLVRQWCRPPPTRPGRTWSGSSSTWRRTTARATASTRRTNRSRRSRR